MKTKRQFFSLALAALVLGACSDDLGVNNGQPQGGATGESGYLSLAINLPTEPSTRANDDFDDGTPAEYDVNNATLILFVGDAIHSAYNMEPNFGVNDPSGNGNITSTARITQQINSVGEATSVKALVVLNHNNVFTVTTDNDLQVAGASMKGKSLDQLNEAIVAAKSGGDWHTQGFLMSNALLNTAAGGGSPAGGTTETLTAIDPAKIFDTPGEAALTPAANIYVERAVAKVTLTAKDGQLTQENPEEWQSYTIQGWALDNTNTKSYLARTTFGAWGGLASNATGGTPFLADEKYRFVGSLSVGQDVPVGAAEARSFYRTYWSQDPNYASMTDGDLTTVGGESIDADDLLAADGSTPDYCFENTSDLASMTEENITRVVVKAQFNGGTPFFTVGGERDRIWLADAVKAEAASRFLSNPTIDAWARANVKSGETLSSTDFVIALSTEVPTPVAGKATVTGVILSEAGEAKLIDEPAALPSEALTIINGEISFEYYLDGAAYYSVWVAHFGDGLTPWNSTETPRPSSSDIYPAANGDANYLGRWGMLRNNWYDINVTGISGLGTPTVSEVTGEPIDKLYQYITVNINVLSWAKRSQDVEL